MTNIDLDAVIRALKEGMLQDKNFIALQESRFLGNEWAYVKECLDTGWVSSVGKFVDRFEDDLSEFTGIKHAVAVVNGTAALHMCLKLIGVERDDEVLVPALTFVATANAVAYCNAIPHFVDCDERTLGLDPVKLLNYLDEFAEVRSDGCYNKKSGRCIKAVIPMHTFGHPVDLDPIVELCKRYKLELIEDAAESLGSLYKNRHTGSFGNVSAVSFNGNKIITSGGGGAILTNNESLAKLAKHLTTTAKLPHRWAFVHDQAGYNYRLPNINAALGCAQLERIMIFLEKKRRLALHLKKIFDNIEGIHFFTEAKYARSNYWHNVILLDEEHAGKRDTLLELASDQNIMTRPAWTLMHKLKMYQDCPRMNLSVSESIERRLISIPSSAANSTNSL